METLTIYDDPVMRIAIGLKPHRYFWQIWNDRCMHLVTTEGQRDVLLAHIPDSRSSLLRIPAEERSR